MMSIHTAGTKYLEVSLRVESLTVGLSGFVFLYRELLVICLRMEGGQRHVENNGNETPERQTSDGLVTQR